MSDSKILPAGWIKKKLCEVATVITGKTPPTNVKKNYGSHLPFVSPADLGKHKYIYESEKYVSEEGAKLLQILPPGSTLFTCIGSTIGKIGLASADLTTNQQINAAIPKKTLIHEEYLYYLLTFIAPRIKKNAGVQAVPIVNKKEFEEQSLLFPVNDPEQKAIAELLSTWDEAIEKTERLIAKKEERFKGLLNDLIAKPSKSGNWKKMRLGEACNVTMGNSPPSKAYNNIMMGLPLLQGKADLKNRKSEPKIYTSAITKTCNIGDLLMSVRAPVGYISISNHKCCIGRGVAAIKVKNEYIKEFVFFSLLAFEHKWVTVSQGGTFEAVSGSEVNGFPIFLPFVEVQKQISELLSFAQKQITLLKQLAEKYKLQKQGLMQKLLTGKWRINSEILKQYERV